MLVSAIRTTIFVLAFHDSVLNAAERSAVVVREDVTYRVVDERAMQLDLAMPPGDQRHPAVLFLHGGGWITGDRSRFREAIEVAAERGFVGATVSYRLAKTGPGVPSVDGFPAPLQDVKAAVRFLRGHADEFRIDPARIGIVGESAGAHLALLAGLTQPGDGLDGDLPADSPSSDVHAIVNVFGPTDLTALARDNPVTKPGLVILIGGVPELFPEEYVAASPVTYARRDAPPILTIHGSADGLVPVSQARLLDQSLRKVGAKHRLIILNGSGHGFGYRDADLTERTIYDFLNATLKSNRAPRR